MTFSFSLILLIVCTIQFYFAAAHAWVWPFFGVAMALVFLIHLWIPSTSERTFSRFWIAVMGIFFAWTAFQCIPLPMDVLAVLSPHRHAVLEASAPLNGVSVTSAAVSYNIGESMAWWVLMLSLWGLYAVLTHQLESRRRLKILVVVLFCLAGFQALYGLVQALVPSMGVLGVSGGHMGNSRGTYFNRNHFAGFMELMFPLCLGYMLALGNWAYRRGAYSRHGRDIPAALGGQTPWFVWAVILLVMFIAVVFSQSRAGITGLFLGLVVFSLLIRMTDKRVFFGLWFIIVAITCIGLIYGYRIGFEGVVGRFMEIGSGEDYRYRVWADALTIIKDHPLGIGLMNFKSVFRVYEVSTSFSGTFRHAHNDILQLFIETGWPGFIVLFGGFLLFLGSTMVKIGRMKPHRDPMRFFLAAGALSGLASIGFHSIFDFNLQIPANMLYFVILSAIVNSCTKATIRD